MKKVYFLILSIMMILLLSSCKNNTLRFEEIKSESYTTYKTQNIEILFFNNIEDKELIENIKSDLNKLNEFYPIKENVKITIDNKYLSNPDIYRRGIYSNEEFAKSEEFKKLLISKIYNIYDNWKLEGIYSVVLENDNSNVVNVNSEIEKSFQDYYKNNDFSLFGGRYIKGFATEEEIINAKIVAKDLVNYLVENNKKEALIKEEIEIGDIKEWAEKNNINTAYYEDIYEHTKNVAVSDLGLDALTMNSKKEINGFRINIASTDDRYDEAKELEQIIKIFEISVQENLQAIKNNAPDFYKDYEKHLTNVPRVYYILDPEYWSNSYNIETKEIRLFSLTVQLAEYNHFLFDESFRYNGKELNRPAWIIEGLDIYLNDIYGKELNKDFQIYINRLKKDKDYIDNHLDYDNKNDIIHKTVLNNMEVFGGEEGLKDFDKKHLFLFAKDVGSVLYPDKFITTYNNTKIDVDEGSMLLYKKSKSNNLTWHQNFSFVRYLIYKYGLEKILYFSVKDFNTVTFEEEFGKSFQELEREWKLFLKENIVGAGSIQID